VSPRTHACSLHRSALLDFVDARHADPSGRADRSGGQHIARDGGTGDVATELALAHLDSCPECRTDLEETALAIVALRRLHSEATEAAAAMETAEAEESADREATPAAWSRLRGRLERPRTPAWQVRTTLGGLLAGAGLVATLVAPVAVWQPRPSSVSESRPITTSVRAERAEQRVQWSRFATPIVEAPSPILAPGEFVGIWRGPDGIGPRSSESVEDAPAGRIR
jgi:hypothetical protein